MLFQGRIFLTLALISLVSGCGYHLKGHGESSLQGVNFLILSENPYGEFEKALAQRMRASGVNINESSSQASLKHSSAAWTVEIVSFDTTEQGISRDATGRAGEAILTAKLSFRLWASQNSAKDALLQSVDESANYIFDYRNPVAKKNQQRETKRFLQQQIAERLLRRLERQIQSL